MDRIRNIFACLVHENRECVIDLVRNLRTLDPSSLILLYNGGPDPDLLNHGFPFERHGTVVHPAPRRAVWGRLHQFALDCMSWALENDSFDTLTIVDSDQLATRAGYSEHLTRNIGAARRIGLFGNSAVVQTAGTRIAPAEVALRETELWRPLLRQFPEGEAKYPHWCFWPSTVFLADAARDLTRLFATNQLLQCIMERTRIWATEELILPTLVALLGYEIEASPFSYDYVQYRVNYSPHHVESALLREDVFWVHPVPRRYDDPLRKLIRGRLNHYEAPFAENRVPDAAAPPLFLTLPILEKMRPIEGWLEDAEAELLIVALTRAIAEHPGALAVVEIGSYCGRSTVVLGSAAVSADPSGKVRIHAIDPHDGVVGAVDRGVIRMPPTLAKFRRNICFAGLDDRVECITKRPFEVEWSQPICLLFIDGLHDYANVARDFHHFAPFVAPGGFIAFHDYAPYWPGVKAFVDELLAGGCYEKVCCAGSMIVVRKTPQETDSADARPDAVAQQQESTPAPAVLTGQPMVSCIMATADRRTLVPQAIRYFERQDYPNKELIVLDDGEDAIADLIPQNASIRYIRIDQRRTMGAKHNAGCELARGDIVVHWDDDDWMAPWRLSYQVESLLFQPRDTLSGLSRLLFWDPRASSAWEYIYPAGERTWVCGGTFCYRKQFWETHRHPDMNEGADTVFVWGLHGTNIAPLENHGFYVAMVHARNTSPKRTNTFGWHAFPVEQVRQLLAADVSFYEDDGRILVP
jgi:predicted O-methyltransferase YrrM